MRQDGATPRAVAILAGVILATTLPFLNKAVHIDDVYFLEIAENILKDPLRPFAGAVALEDVDYRVFAAKGRCPETFAAMAHPPLVPYVLAAAARIRGCFSEPALHMALLPFALFAGLAGYSLARRFTRHPLVATLLLVSSPIFAMSSESLTTDMAALALGLSATAWTVAGLDEARPSKVLLGGVLAGLAMLTRYSSLLTLLLIAAYGLLQGKGRKTLPALASSAAVFLVWCAQNLLSSGRLHILASAEHYASFFEGQSFGAAALLKKGLGDLAALGGTAFVAAVVMVVSGSWRRPFLFFTMALGALALFAAPPAGILRLETYSPLERGAVALDFACGAVLVGVACWPRGGRGRGEGAADQRFLALWLLGALGLAVVVLPFGTARYVLPVLPPLFILLVRRAEESKYEGSWLAWAAGASVAQGLLLSAVLGFADFEYAGRYRALAGDVRRSHPSQKLFYVGEWGFRFYMDKAGGTYLRSSDESPGMGDLVVRPQIAGMHEMSEGVQERAARTETIELQSSWPVRLMSFDAKAGYYSVHWGYLPWALSRAPLERIEIFEVREPAPPAEATSCASS